MNASYGGRIRKGPSPSPRERRPSSPISAHESTNARRRHGPSHRPWRTPLSGRIMPSANKNAVLPILCATLLTQPPAAHPGVPEITDVRKILEIFRTLGSEVRMDFATGVLELHHRDTHFDPRRPPPAGGDALLDHAGAAAAGALRRGAHRERREGLHAGRARDRPARRGAASASARRSSAAASRCSSAPTARCARRPLARLRLASPPPRTSCSARRWPAAQSTLMNAASEPHVQEFCGFMAHAGRAHRRHRHLAAHGGRRATRSAAASSRFDRGLPRGRHLPGAGRHHRRRRRGEELGARAVPADRPHLRQVRRAGRARGRLVPRPRSTAR